MVRRQVLEISVLNVHHVEAVHPSPLLQFGKRFRGFLIRCESLEIRGGNFLMLSMLFLRAQDASSEDCQQDSAHRPLVVGFYTRRVTSPGAVLAEGLVKLPTSSVTVEQ